MAEKILIVDDDIETLRLVGMMLQRQGYQILAATNGTQAISTAINELPDLIILDVMMPDLDGYEVTRRLRADIKTASTPILMFTAKSQVDDKVTGYDSGADDYLTKPVHPAELIAHIKALFSRKGYGRAGVVAAGEQGNIIAVVAPKGGLGASTVALNLAINLHEKTDAGVIAVEMRPGHGTWATELGFSNPTGLNNLLKQKPADLSPAVVENELMRTTYGIRLLMASTTTKDVELGTATMQFENILQHLSHLAQVVVLDFGAIFLANYDRLLNYAQEAIVVTEAFPVSIQGTRLLINELGVIGFGKSRLLTVVANNRVRADVQLSITQMQEMLGQPITHVIPPAPEASYQAALHSLPMLQMQPDGLVAQQFEKLTDSIIKHLKLTK